jgi:uncharacterized membrane protein YbjE (DUF340 family)
MIKMIVTALFLGSLSGYFFLTPEVKPMLDRILLAALNLTVVIAGIDIGSNRQLIKKMMNWKTAGLMVAVPGAVTIGSVLGGMVMGKLLGLAVYDALLISVGMGWYSLSSVVIATMYNTEIGTIAFFTNFLRELSAFIFVPILAKFTSVACAAVGGATVMDSTLPVLIKSAGMSVGIIGFISGFILTLIIPFLLSLLLG